MLDVHSHILPGLDDGAADSSQALEMIAQAEKQGVQVIFVTPHCCDGVYNCTKQTVLSACQNLSERAATQHLNIRILPGAEIRVNHDLMERFDAGDLLTLGDGGRFLLLELPPMFIVNAVFRMMQQLKERGIIPIIAHAERNPMIAGRLELADELTFMGIKLQITAGSLTGDFGKPVCKIARKLLEKDQVFCLGSDMHPGRKYRMKADQKKLFKWVGSEKTHTLVTENPAQILTDTDSSMDVKTYSSA